MQSDFYRDDGPIHLGAYFHLTSIVRNGWLAEPNHCQLLAVHTSGSADTRKGSYSDACVPGVATIWVRASEALAEAFD